MATLKPQLIRADTMDLQDHEAPSAQTHISHMQGVAEGRPAAHQEDAMRHVSEERNAERDHLAYAWDSGRSSHEGSELLDEDIRMSGEDSRVDEAALQQNGGEDIETMDVETDDMIDDRMSSSPSIDDNEDIDPDYVYALQNFVATVEGQANATKGDAMVLLDDQNSYWWLVRLSKDGTIGYLPAEHIELPVEREARQNKHRNLELARRMLLDEPSRSKNPLKKAMKRRNAKKVVFPDDRDRDTFYEPSEHEWSDEELDAVPDGLADGSTVSQTQSEAQTNQAENGVHDSKQSDNDGIGPNGEIRPDPSSDQQAARSGLDGRVSEDPSNPEDSSQRPLKSGTIRNTDSFFGDDSVEPRKISLTPNLLRDESADDSARSSGSTDKAPSSQEFVDQVDKSTTDKLKEDKKKKDKKSGMFGKIFGKKTDKKIKVDEAPGGTLVKHDAEPSSPVPVSDPSSPIATSPSSPLAPGPLQPKKSGSKLTKTPPTTNANQAKSSVKATEPVRSTAPLDTVESSTSVNSGHAMQSQTSEQESVKAKPFTRLNTSTINPSSSSMQNAISRTPPEGRGFPRETNGPVSTDERQQSQSNAEGAKTEDVPVSPVVSQAEPNTSRNAPSLSADTSRTVSPPSPVEMEEEAPPRASAVAPSAAHERLAHHVLGRETPGSHSDVDREPSSRGDSRTAKTPSLTSQFPVPPERPVNKWNEAAFQTYLKDRHVQDAKDLLLIVQDRNGVQPLPLDHPIMLGYGFYDHQKRLDEMGRQLDGMLNGFLARKAARPRTNHATPR